MKVNVHVRNKLIEVHCGDGAQPVKWLADVGIFRFDASFGVSLGAPKAVRLENGTVLEPSVLVRDALKDGDTVYVVLRNEEEGRKDTDRDDDDDGDDAQDAR
jgi:hypothetical protein